jgi:hypothetical protein
MHYAMKTYRAVEVYIHAFLNSVPVGGEWSTSGLGRFTPGEIVPGADWREGWVEPCDVVDATLVKQADRWP